MADTQIIRIQYVADTAGLNQSKTAAQQAQQATDNLRSSAQKMGTDGAAAANKYQGAIAFVKAELEKTKTLIDLTNRSDIKLLNERIAKYRQLKAEVDKFNKSLEESNKTTKANAVSFGQLYSAIKTVLAAALVREVVNTTLEMARLSGAVDGVERAFKRAFPASQVLLAELRDATHGAVSDFELMQRTLQASNLGLDVNKLGVLFEFAAARAQQTGESVDYLVDSIVRGIGRKSILVLDNLGLSATRLKQQFNGVSIASKSVAEVTEGVAQIASVELQKMGGYAENTATQVAQIEANWQKLKQTIADRSTSKAVLDFYNATILNVEASLKSVKELEVEEARRLAIIEIRSFKERQLTADVVKDRQKAADIIQQEINSTLQVIGRNNDRIQQSKEVVKTLNQEVLTKRRIGEEDKKRIESNFQQGKYYEFQNLKLAAIILNLKEYLKTFTDVTEATEESLGLIQAKMNEIEDVSDKLKAAKSTDEIHALNLELAKLNGELADLKAFGTTKQFLEVNGKIKLVPVVDPKGFQKALEQEPIFREGVTIPAKIGFTQGTRSSANSGTGGVQGSLSEQIEKQIQDAVKNIPPINVPVNITPMTDMERIGQEFADNWQNILGQGLNDTGNFLSAVVQANADSYDQRLNQARSYYDNLISLAGDNEGRKQRLQLESKKMEDKLRREAFEADKKAKKSQAAINGAVGITNAFATLPYPAAIVASLIIAASTAAQIAVINKETPKFAKGKVNISGPGTRTSDSIHAKISRGESVINASSTERSMKLLEGINSGKIDDRILKRLHVTQTGVKVVNGIDDSRIVSAIKGNRAPDLQRVGRVLHEVQTLQDGFSKRVRRKSMSR